MFTVDPASFVLTNGLVSVVLAAVLLVSRVGMGAEGRGIRTWVVGDLALAAARICTAGDLAGSPWLPGVAFPLVEGCFAAVGVVAHAQGLRSVSGQPTAPARIAFQCAGLAAFYYAVTSSLPSLSHRLRCFDFMLLMASLCTLWLLRPLLRFWGARLIAMMMVLGVVYQGLRFGALFLGLGWEPPDTAQSNLRGNLGVSPLVVDLLIGLMLTGGFALLIQERLRERIERLVVTDALTGALNRHGIMPLLKGALTQAHRHGRPLSVVMFDLDHFKRINDQHGHAAGDQVLAGFAAHVGAQLRQSDQFSRWGGEEFLLLLADTEQAAAHAVAERLCRSVAQTPMDGRTLQVTVSAGVASLEAGSLESPGPSARSLLELLDTADRRLYLAKKRRNCVVSSEILEPAVVPG